MLLFPLSVTTAIIAPAIFHSVAPAVSWKECLRQPAAWYGSPDAARIAGNVLLYQQNNGGWEKNLDMAKPLSAGTTAQLREDKDAPYSTIDNGATYTQLRFLAKVYSANKEPRLRQAFDKGLEYLLAAQYPNGGWPQYYPLRKGYYTHITFNDNAMVGVLELLRDIADQKQPEFAFTSPDQRSRAAAAIPKGIAAILQCQVKVNGTRTVWCAQHDETTFAPAPARAYEKISLSGSESVGIVRFLMEVEKPTPEIVEAVRGAVAWLKGAQVTGLRLANKPDPTGPKGFDTVVEKDPTAPPLWARFYDVATGRPIFCGRDGIIKNSLAEIEIERRAGYRWYGEWPATLVEKEYPRWEERQSLSRH